MIQMRFEGVPQMRAAIAKLSPGAERAARKVVKRSALNVQNAAKRATPVDTGRLRNSITHEIDNDGMDATIGTNVEYAPHVEFGTRHNRPKPFLFPAVEAERPKFHAAMKAEVRAALIQATD